MSEEVQIPVSNEQHDVQPVEQEGGGVEWISQNWEDGFLESLPNDLGQHSIFQKYATPNDFIQGAINAQSQIGQKASEFLNSDDPSIVAERNAMLGVPETPDGYQYEIPEGFEVDESDIAEFSAAMHELGLNNVQAQAIAEYNLQNMAAMVENFQTMEAENIDAVENELREIWRGDTFEYNMSKVGDALEYLGLGEWRDDPAIANNVSFLTGMVDKILPLFSDDELIEGGQIQSYSAVEDQLRQVESEMESYPNVNDAGYQQLIKLRTELLQKLS